MKITVSPTGIAIDLADEILLGVEIMRGEMSRQPAPVVLPDPPATEAVQEAKPTLFGMSEVKRSKASLDPTPVESAAKSQAAAELTKAQYKAWEVLEMNKNARRGVTPAAVARELKISPEAAVQRLCQLYKLGFAKRLSPGRYCSTTPSASSAA